LSNKWRTYKAYRLVILVTLFIAFLTAGRILWIHHFQSSEQPYVIHGQLDLRSWNAAQGQTITLDGQWEFYPNLLIESGIKEEINIAHPHYIKVPGHWNDSLKEAVSTPYGYGSYRLQILVNPDHQYTYSIRVPSVRSSSSLFVNGRNIAGSGKPAAQEQDYVAENLPYTASFTANEQHMIEIIIHVANYKDPRHSGIVRSMKFGLEKSVADETHFSISMQQLIAVVFFMHAMYAIFIYIIGSKDCRLVYFSIITTFVTIMILLGSEEKILHHWVKLSYEVSFRLMHLAMLILAFSIFAFIARQMSGVWKKLIPWYGCVCLILFFYTIVWPLEKMIAFQFLHSTLIFISIILAICLLFYTAMKRVTESIILLLFFIALTSNFAWHGILMFTGTKVVYYPFDLIIAMSCSAIFSFRKYFQIHHETKALASKLQKMHRVKDEFLANTSHELRNPLHSILNILQSVLEREQHTLNRRSIKDLETVQVVGRQMSYMLNDLLYTMSLKEKIPRLQLNCFSIRTIAAGVIDMFQFMIEGKPVRIVNRISEQLPLVYADEKRVIQIIYNLLHNAVKFTAEGEISIDGYSKDDRVYIIVADTGTGIDKASLHYIFEPYGQALNDGTMSEGGFGLGLSICKQLVELHGGVLVVKSVPNQGSEFTFSLPSNQSIPSDIDDYETAILAVDDFSVAQEVRASTTILDDHDDESRFKLSWNAPRVLVVDDDPVNLKVIKNILMHEDYEIVTVTSGKQALERLDTQEWDLIITDVMMPKMSGYELTYAIRQRFTITELPILLLTARGQLEDIENGFRSGANDYVLKPVAAIELKSRVKALTIVKQSLRERMNMEAAFLQAQIQPHFLFNTLNSISALSEIDLQEMRQLLEAFGSFLRDKFKFRNMDELAPLKDELSIVQSYLYIEQVRYEERLQVIWEIEDCGQMKIPMLTIQPLVENAIRHGIMTRAQGGIINIRISNDENAIEISVSDNGVGMNEERVLQQLEGRKGYDSGVGLINTNTRLKRLYGTGLQIKSKLGEGTTIAFCIPKSSSNIHKVGQDRET